ncbi:sensor histidine kinase [Ammoniphilus resinae]|uniref:histidine kinase n=1 Tax=Ammoniphilus resinae TaxID=861532 RepID=A0ABS4GRA2_9BACL|nr:HAMP domain-containing sensor histidine kinase [Ammoniphilus resinae]MBP1932794.1 signal transduction histidine kinase [Ammoniphilus resinae]
MSIKIRLLLSYIAMTFIPVLLIALIATTLVPLYFGAGGETKMPAFWELSNQRKELTGGIKFMAQTAPNRFTDPAFLKNIDKQLNQVKSALVVKKQEKLIFVSEVVDTSNLDALLKQFQQEPAQPPWERRVNGRYSVEQYNITFSDQSTGTVYVISDWNQFYEGASRFFPLLLLSLLIVVGITNGILTLLVSRSIIRPLFSLKKAADQIKEGNLDHTVDLKRKDEIGKLGAAFEEMRIRLKESIHLQLQYEENRKELIASMTHDLKTPITGIKACVQGIQEGIVDTEQKREKYMNMIAGKAEEMDQLIDELMLYSKLDLRRLPFHFEEMDLAAYLQDGVDELRYDPRMENVQISFIPTSNQTVPVTADRDKLHRVFMNIVENSLKYMNKEQKEICVELIDEKEEAIVRIRDNGPGIEDSALPQIFNRFYRTEPSRNSETGGTGLGLAIVKQIIEGHGGRVWAESKMGEGTSIYFTLPKSEQRGEDE